MAAPATTAEFLDLVKKSGVADEKRFDAWLSRNKTSGLPAKPTEAAGLLVRDSILTTFQAEQILQGKWKRFTIGKYKVLEKLGSGGMGSVYLCEHKLMRRRVAVKVLPTAKAQDESALQRFYREARAVAALDHPNIVHAYDIDQDETLHFLVMEYVDGASLQDIVKKAGPLDISRACHYIHQAALGLEHASQASLIHRDIKPGNILVDRTGVVKILDMGLARFFNDEDDVLTKKFDENVLGTADYLAPEQAIDSHEVDIRADIYSLGATFYYMLTGKTPFGDGTVAQKLLWHQNRQPKPVTEFRPEVPADLAALIAKMMAKEKTQRYQTPAAVAAALEPFVQAPIGPPPDAEMPHLSPAAIGPGAPAMETADTAIVKGGTAAPRALQGMSPSSQAGRVTTTNAPLVTPPPSSHQPGSAPGRIAAVNAPGTAPASGGAPLSSSGSHASAPMFAVTAAQEAAAEVEEAPWESLSTVDTEDPSAKADTAPRSVTVRRLKPSASVKNPRLARLVFAMMGLGALLAGGAVVAYLIMNQTPTTTNVRKPLLVTKDAGGPNTYKSIMLALKAAQPGDVIQIADAEHAENLLLDQQRLVDVTLDVIIEAAPNKEVVWRPESKNADVPLLRLQNAKNLKIRGKGITFDGAIDDKKRVKDLIVVNFKCPGLEIDGATLTNFGHAAISVVNVQGDDKKPAEFKNLRIVGTAPQPEAGVFIQANPDVQPDFNDFLSFRDTHIDGVKQAVEKKDNFQGTHIEWPQ